MERMRYLTSGLQALVDTVICVAAFVGSSPDTILGQRYILWHGWEGNNFVEEINGI
jgi:hypothetical protein